MMLLRMKGQISIQHVPSSAHESQQDIHEFMQHE